MTINPMLFHLLKRNTHTCTHTFPQDTHTQKSVTTNALYCTVLTKTSTNVNFPSRRNHLSILVRFWLVSGVYHANMRMIFLAYGQKPENRTTMIANKGASFVHACFTAEKNNNSKATFMSSGDTVLAVVVSSH